MLKSKKAFGAETIIYLMLIAVIVISIGSFFATNFFDKPEIKVGTLMLFIIMGIAAYGAFGIANKLSKGLISKNDVRNTVVIVGLTALGLYLLYTYLPTLLENTTILSIIP